MAEIAASTAWQELKHQATHLLSLASEEVPTPPLTLGLHFLRYQEIREEPQGISWRETHYQSFSPWVFRFHDIALASDAGIAFYEDRLIADTLEHTSPELQGYAAQGPEIILRTGNTHYLKGTHLSLLAGSHQNYFHAVVDCLGRLAAMPEALLREADALLVPAHAAGLEQAIALLGLPVPRRPVFPNETLHVEQLLLPSTLHGQTAYHPVLLSLFDRIAERIEAIQGKGDGGLRPYIDRRQSAARPLVNEGEIIETLAPLGFRAVPLEGLTVREQAALFMRAECVVAPHGAGLVNLAYARPGNIVLELLPARYVHWAFRRLSALRGLIYDRVIGREACGHSAFPAMPASAPWRASAQHVAAAAGHLLERACAQMGITTPVPQPGHPPVTRVC